MVSASSPLSTLRRKVRPVVPTHVSLCTCPPLWSACLSPALLEEASRPVPRQADGGRCREPASCGRALGTSTETLRQCCLDQRDRSPQAFRKSPASWEAAEPQRVASGGRWGLWWSPISVFLLQKGGTGSIVHSSGVSAARALEWVEGGGRSLGLAAGGLGSPTQWGRVLTHSPGLAPAASLCISGGLSRVLARTGVRLGTRVGS